jgi:hypothetical protein
MMKKLVCKCIKKKKEKKSFDPEDLNVQNSFLSIKILKEYKRSNKVFDET